MARPRTKHAFRWAGRPDEGSAGSSPYAGPAADRGVARAATEAGAEPPPPATGAGAEPPPRPTESLAARYSRIAGQQFEPRTVDLVLRGLDVAIAGTGLVATSPVMAAIAVALRVDSGPPVLYRGRRVGRAGEIFTMYKFRTLAPDAESRLGPYSGAELTARTRAEVTPVGSRLRTTQLDELPQLWNVLRGDMSIVGPRPIRPTFFEELCGQIPQYWQRLVVRPGMTGFAQMRVTRDHSWAEKLAHDLEYIADRSVPLYGLVVAETAWRVLRKVGSALLGRARSAARGLMCGICGIVNLQGDSPPDREALAAMNAALAHRGPDDEGTLLDGPAGLAMRRLSIIDLPGGHQPIANESGTVHVVLNGEIYNYRELREGLVKAGHRFRTRSDTEVLVHLYEDRGDDFLGDLRGMFALALWDSPRRRLLLARDRFGIKPLYWTAAQGRLSFASELGALARQPGFDRQIDLRAVEAFLAFNSIPSPLTIHDGVRKLRAGHKLVLESGAAHEERFARPRPAAADALRPERSRDLAAELRGRLRDSVRAHLVADVPVGVMLSGGIDSSALVALAAAESGSRVSTFSIGFEERSYDELDLARSVADRYGTDHHELILRPDAAALLPQVVAAFDEPFADSSALPTYLVSKLASEHVKVALSGEGGDELFGGYHTYVADLIAPRLGPLAAAARPLVERLPSGSGRVPLDYKAKRFTRGALLPPLERHHAWKEIFSADARAELLGGRDGHARDGGALGGHAPGGGTPLYDPLDLYRERYAETEGAEPLARLQDVDLGIYLVDDLLTKTDRASMAHSLEARVPFLDTAVSDLALALPTRMKVRGFAKKWLLRRAVAPLLPRQVVFGRKRGFSIPAAAWLRGELEPFARDVLSSDTLRRQGFFEPAAVGRLLDRHVAAEEDLSRQIWGLMSFSLWYDQNMAAVPAA